MRSRLNVTSKVRSVSTADPSVPFAVGRINGDKIDSNSPTAEGLQAAHVQAMEYIDVSAVDAFIEEMRHLLGAELSDATVAPDHDRRFRGGPYLLGGVYRRVWKFTWEKVPADQRKYLDSTTMKHLGGVEMHLILQWCSFLPFAIVVVRAPFMQNARYLEYALDDLLDELPGQMWTQTQPRAASQILLYAKVSETRMKRMLAAMKSGTHDGPLRKDLASSLKVLGKALGDVQLGSMAPNVLLVEGEESRMMGDDDGPQCSFRAFIHSYGNLGPREGLSWNLPLRIPAHLGTSSWMDFDFHPLLRGAIRNAHHIGAEAGILDEALSELSKQLPGAPAATNKVRLASLHKKLVALHARAQQLAAALHQGRTRSPLSSAEPPWADVVRYHLKEANPWPEFRAYSDSSESLRQLKVQTEENTRLALDGIECRLDRALDLVTTVETRKLTRSLRLWAIVAVVFTAAGIVFAFVR